MGSHDSSLLPLFFPPTFFSICPCPHSLRSSLPSPHQACCPPLPTSPLRAALPPGHTWLLRGVPLAALTEQGAMLPMVSPVDAVLSYGCHLAEGHGCFFPPKVPLQKAICQNFLFRTFPSYVLQYGHREKCRAFTLKRDDKRISGSQ